MRYNKKYLKPISLVIILICIILFINLIISGNSTILNYLKTNSSKYIYITSITGENNEKADVYKSNSDLDSTAKDIINSINGEVESVQQNTEDGDNSIAILTNDEYCLIYISEDKEVLIQVSSRKNMPIQRTRVPIMLLVEHMVIIEVTIIQGAIKMT